LLCATLSRCTGVSDIDKYCPDALWCLAQPLLPEHPKRHQGGSRRPVADRVALAAIVYVLQTGCAWGGLPASFPISTPTAHRWFTEWVELGVFAALHQAMLEVLGAAGELDWSRCSVDTMQVRALKGGS
jgi:transposase